MVQVVSRWYLFELLFDGSDQRSVLGDPGKRCLMILNLADSVWKVSRRIKEFCESFSWVHGFIIPHNGRRHQDKQAESYGQVGREFKLRPLSAGSILTLRNKIEPLRFRIDVGARANIKARISHLAGE